MKRLGIIAASLGFIIIPPQTIAASFEEGACSKLPNPVSVLAKARCGFLVVPENRNKPNGRQIHLHVAIIPALAKNPAPDPIVYMAGGPGGSAFPSTEMLVKAHLNQNRNLIIMDQRGTSYSSPALLCPEIDQFNARKIGLPYDSPSTGILHVEATRACFNRLQATGADLGAYNTTENAADFADLRVALGIKEWNVYGVSYGTDLALTYMTHHPEGVRSVTIDSVVPPNLVNLGMFWTNGSVGLNTIFRECAAQPKCKARYPKLKQNFEKLVTQLESQPITGWVKPVIIPGDKPPSGTKAVKVILDGGAFVNWAIGVTEMLGPELPALLEQLSKGKAHAVLASYAATGVAHAGDYSYGLLYGVVCSEWLPYQTANTVIAAGRSAFPNFPATVLAQSPQFPFMEGDCRIWQVPKAPASQREIKGSIPTLVISGSYDGVTSPKFAKAAADALSNAKFVLIPGIGHFVVPKSKCAQNIMASFLLNPANPDTRCINKLKPPPFKIKNDK